MGTTKFVLALAAAQLSVAWQFSRVMSRRKIEEDDATPFLEAEETSSMLVRGRRRAPS